MTNQAGTKPTTRVFVAVGTDHHPFDRLINWTNEWLGAHPEQAELFFVQSGTVKVTPACPSSRFLDVDEMTSLLDRADVLVCHGGPGTIASAWDRGLLPIVVPRLPELGEHVDDHQLRFSVKLAELGRVWLAHSQADFAEFLSKATGDPACLRADVPSVDLDATVARFGELVEELVRRPKRRLPLRRRTQRISATADDQSIPSTPHGLTEPAPTPEASPMREAAPMSEAVNDQNTHLTRS